MNAAKTEILENLRNWATHNKDVICVVCAGSHGNKEKVADDFSDLDIVMFTNNVKFYLNDFAWIESLGQVGCQYVDKSRIPGIPGVKKVYFANGVRLDVLFWTKSMLNTAYAYLTVKEKTIFTKLLPPIVRKIIEVRFSYFPKYIRHGFNTIVDKRRYARKIEYVERTNRFKEEPFSLQKLKYTVDRFWAVSLTTSIYIRRNDLLAAKIIGDRSMKQLLLHLIELYAKLIHGEDFFLWQDGRRVDQWAPQFITKRLRNIFAHYDADDSWRGAMETMDLFSLICSRLETEFPHIKFSNPEKHFRKMIHAVGVGRPETMLEV